MNERDLNRDYFSLDKNPKAMLRLFKAADRKHPTNTLMDSPGSFNICLIVDNVSLNVEEYGALVGLSLNAAMDCP
jgi:hypothetical protein